MTIVEPKPARLLLADQPLGKSIRHGAKSAAGNDSAGGQVLRLEVANPKAGVKREWQARVCDSEADLDRFVFPSLREEVRQQMQQSSSSSFALGDNSTHQQQPARNEEGLLLRWTVTTVPLQQQQQQQQQASPESRTQDRALKFKAMLAAGEEHLRQEVAALHAATQHTKHKTEALRRHDHSAAEQHHAARVAALLRVTEAVAVKARASALVYQKLVGKTRWARAARIVTHITQDEMLELEARGALAAEVRGELPEAALLGFRMAHFRRQRRKGGGGGASPEAVGGREGGLGDLLRLGSAAEAQQRGAALAKRDQSGSSIAEHCDCDDRGSRKAALFEQKARTLRMQRVGVTSGLADSSKVRADGALAEMRLCRHCVHASRLRS
ncbi:hypothetical protein JKP88DRAFT_251493 [Tribonema minus]|uniref:Uncharacterized protein n=1 Tax=Tribonema minus TaxID=303371 RepID=A0A835ZEB8_9STRA|nr:hypothetical protein JKP88DRAFT_251493 [Tribonema minus]